MCSLLADNLYILNGCLQRAKIWHNDKPTSYRPLLIDNIIVEQIEFPDLIPLRKAESRGENFQCYPVGLPYLIAGQHMNPILDGMWFLSKISCLWRSLGYYCLNTSLQSSWKKTTLKRHSEDCRIVSRSLWNGMWFHLHLADLLDVILLLCFWALYELPEREEDYWPLLKKFVMRRYINSSTIVSNNDHNKQEFSCSFAEMKYFPYSYISISRA